MPYIIDNITADTVNVTETLKINGEEIGPKYKVYTALLTQNGTNAPVATVLENTLGDIVWGYVSEGIYECTLFNGFTEDKTGILTTSTSDGYTEAYWNDINTCQVLCFRTDGTKGNGLLYKQLIEIRVYN